MQNLADENSLIPTARGAGIAVCGSSPASLGEFARALNATLEKRIVLLVRHALSKARARCQTGAERFAECFSFWLVISSAKGTRLHSQASEGARMVSNRVFAV
jgi:hypothetical protein